MSPCFDLRFKSLLKSPTTSEKIPHLRTLGLPEKVIPDASLNKTGPWLSSPAGHHVAAI